MSPAGGAGTLPIQVRAALLDALEALEDQRDAVIVIGAQAVYLHTGQAEVALAETTKDSDLAINPRKLVDDPLLEQAMRRAGFYPRGDNPGTWLSPGGIPVDLMVPETLAGPGGKNTRGARIAPHDKGSTRRARGLEAALVDNSILPVAALGPQDSRVYQARVAGPTALLVAKLHKLGERQADPRRLENKDAHDVYRIFVAIEIPELVAAFRRLAADPLSAEVTARALQYLQEMFAESPDATGSRMAGDAEAGIGDPEQVSLSVQLLAEELLRSLAAD